MAIHNRHDFHAFSALRWSDFRPATFGHNERRIDEAFFFIQRAVFTKLVGNVRQNQTQNLVAAPSLKAPMHSFVVRIALRQHVPLRTCVENPQNRFQHMTSRNRLASSTPIGNMLLRKMLPNAPPLFVRQPNHSSFIADRQQSGILRQVLEIASYIYAADSAIPRGGNTDAQLGARWRRKLRFVIPVRQPNLWSSDPVLSALVETISFLSDDDYEFEFRLLENPQPVEGYFAFTGDKDVRFTPDRVILFSGGLDLLAGTIEELVAHGKKVALVSHRSASKIVNAQKYLIKELQTRFGADRVLHVPVWAHLKDSLGKEPTHRTRSFLFAALGAVTAKLLDRQRIFFFENGVVSLNLPPVAQVVGARATRTTHPQALAGFRRVLSGFSVTPLT